MHFRFISVLLLFVFLIGCSNTNNHIKLTAEDKDVEVLDEFLHLNYTKEEVSTGTHFQVLKAFFPDEKNLARVNLQEEEFEFIKLNGEENLISGTLIYENTTSDSLSIKTLFLQGNEIAALKPSTSEEWSHSILYEVPPKSTIQINIDINWNKKGASELTFFPLSEDDEVDRYNGVNLNTYRYYVQNDDDSANKDSIDAMIREQSFTMENEEFVDVFPILSWIDESNNEIEFVVNEEENELLTTEKVSGVRLEKIPYDTKVDIISIDELGNTFIIEENLYLKKNESTSIEIKEDIIDEMYAKTNKHFIMLFNNRNDEMMADVKALDDYKKPFLTSYQGILEFHSICSDC